eukprot:712985-Hanusia_phi.AAC.2
MGIRNKLAGGTESHFDSLPNIASRPNGWRHETTRVRREEEGIRRDRIGREFPSPLRASSIEHEHTKCPEKSSRRDVLVGRGEVVTGPEREVALAQRDSLRYILRDEVVEIFVHAGPARMLHRPHVALPRENLRNTHVKYNADAAED